MSEITHVEIASEMKATGGSFVRALGEALLHADSENVRKIRSTWGDYWRDYERRVIAAKRKEQFKA